LNDAAGNKQSFTGPDNVTITYHWDKGLLTRVAIPNQGSIYYNSYKKDKGSSLYL
jgi:hypothetical protein